MEHVSFEVLNKHMEEKLSDASLYRGARFSYLKILQHALSYDLTKSTQKKIATNFQSSFWWVKLKYILKAWRNGQIPTLALKKSVIIDKGRIYEEEGMKKSHYFNNLLSALGPEHVSLLQQRKNHGLAALSSLEEIGVARGVMPKQVQQIWLEIRTIIRSLQHSNKFTSSECEYIEGCLHVFFEDYFRFYRIFQNQTQVKSVFFCVHYHQEGLIAALRDLGIKSVEIQHGLISASDYYYVYSKQLSAGLKDALFPDIIGLYGQYWKNILLRGAEWKPEQLCVFGDYLPRTEKKYLPPFQKENWIFIGAQKNVDKEYVDYILQLRKHVAEKHPDWKIVAKLHPIEKNPQAYHAIADQYIQIVGNESSLDELLSKSKIQISIYSTTFYDALGFDVVNYSIQHYSPFSAYAAEAVQEGVAEPIAFEEDPIEKFSQRPEGTAYAIQREEVYAPFKASALQELL